MKKSITFILILLSFSLLAQSQAAVKGTLVDKTGEAIIGGNITFFQKKVKKFCSISDIDGTFSVNMQAGIYDIEFTYLGLKTLRLKNVNACAGQIINLNNVTMEDIVGLTEMVCPSYKVPLIDISNTTSGRIFIAEEIGRMPR
jgi:Carboxypeptidase regulatory-like domain